MGSLPFLDGLDDQLIAFAAQLFKNARPPRGSNASLGTMEDHLRSLERQGVRLDDRQRKSLGLPLQQERTRLPEARRHLWEWFVELMKRRTAGPHGPNPLSYQEVGAWASLTGRRPSPREVRVLLQMDDVAIKSYRDTASDEAATRRMSA